MSVRPLHARAVRAIVRKDLSAVLRRRAVTVPLIVVPLIFLIGIPFIVGYGTSLLPGLDPGLVADLERVLEQAPDAIVHELAGLSPEAQMVVLALRYFIAPLFLVVPLMVASVIAADSFAGERERGTMEALLYTPTDDRELFLGKALAALLPAAAVAIGGGVVYTIIANAAAWPVLGRPVLPTPMWIGLILWVGPAVAALGLAATVWISARVDSFQEAYQLSGILVLPIVALAVAQAVGLLYLNALFVLALGGVAWSLALLILRAGWRRFTRDDMAARM